MENFSVSAGITWAINHENLSRPIFPAPAAASLKIASWSVFLTRVRLCFKSYTILSPVVTKTTDVFHWNSKTKGTFDTFVTG